MFKPLGSWVNHSGGGNIVDSYANSRSCQFSSCSAPNRLYRYVRSNGFHDKGQ